MSAIHAELLGELVHAPVEEERGGGAVPEDLDLGGSRLEGWPASLSAGVVQGLDGGLLGGVARLRCRMGSPEGFPRPAPLSAEVRLLEEG